MKKAGRNCASSQKVFCLDLLYRRAATGQHVEYENKKSQDEKTVDKAATNMGNQSDQPEQY